MKTKSITSIAALLGVAVTLNLSAIAGPGMQQLPSWRRDSSEQKTLCVTASKVRKMPTIALSVTMPGAPLTQESGPHGINYIYRR